MVYTEIICELHLSPTIFCLWYNFPVHVFLLNEMDFILILQVKSKLEILSSYADAVEGMLTHGWIAKIESHGCFVRFYNGVQGFAPRLVPLHIYLIPFGQDDDLHQLHDMFCQNAYAVVIIVDCPLSYLRIRLLHL